jgi:hypothetical protein
MVRDHSAISTSSEQMETNSSSKAGCRVTSSGLRDDRQRSGEACMSRSPTQVCGCFWSEPRPTCRHHSTVRPCLDSLVTDRCSAAVIEAASHLPTCSHIAASCKYQQNGRNISSCARSESMGWQRWELVNLADPGGRASSALQRASSDLKWRNMDPTARGLLEFSVCRADRPERLRKIARSRRFRRDAGFWIPAQRIERMGEHWDLQSPRPSWPLQRRSSRTLRDG